MFSYNSKFIFRDEFIKFLSIDFSFQTNVLYSVTAFVQTNEQYWDAPKALTRLPECKIIYCESVIYFTDQSEDNSHLLMYMF